MRKGFTLIELLAVIVILAIIALIATPIVLNIIKDSRESAGLRSAEMYLDAVEQSISVEKMKNTTFKPNECTITDKGNLDCDTKDGILEVKVNGDKPLNGSITFEEGKIKKATLEYKNDKVIVMNTEGKLQYQKYISISNYQHKHTNGKVENHVVKFDSDGHGTCSKCMGEVLAAGLYDENDNLVASWDTLVNDYGLDITADGIGGSPLLYSGNPESLAARVLQNNDLAVGSKFVIEKNVTNIGIAQFKESNIKEVLIPNSVTSIDSYTFENCTGLASINLPNSIESIGKYAFQNCTSLTSITIPKSVTSISDNAFNDCTGLTTISIPDSVTSIGDYAFQGCTGLTTIEIPNSVKSIGDYAFANISATIIFQEGIEFIGGFKNYKGPSITIPDSVTSISDNAFNGCTGLTTISIPDSVTSIGNNAFSGCTGLTSITIPDSVTSIGSSAFYGFTSLKSIEISDSVTSIGYYAFQNCTGLTSIYIPSSVTTINAPYYPPAPFYGCSSTLKIYTGVKEDEIPSGWGTYWNYYDSTNTLDVTYGVTREQYEELIKQ